MYLTSRQTLQQPSSDLTGKYLSKFKVTAHLKDKAMHRKLWHGRLWATNSKMPMKHGGL